MNDELIEDIKELLEYLWWIEGIILTSIKIICIVLSYIISDRLESSLI